MGNYGSGPRYAGRRAGYIPGLDGRGEHRSEERAHGRDDALRAEAAQQFFLGTVADTDHNEPGRMPRRDPGGAVREGDRVLGADAEAAAGDEQEIRGGTGT